MNAPIDYDMLIIGGGLVGASLACALAEQGLRIGLVEAVPLSADTHPGYDDRTLALAHGTHLIFQSLELWEALDPAATSIEKVHISERGGLGVARLDCRDMGVEALGYVIEARALGQILLQRLQAANIELLCPARLETISVGATAVRATLHTDDAATTVTTRLLVAADGARSQVRHQLGVDAIRWDYGQSAVIANASPTLPHRNIAFERFTDSGPVALLPMSQGRCAVICSVARAAADAIVQLDDTAFIDYLQSRFGDRLGAFQRIGQRQAYPLFMVKSREHTRHRVALIGNAAHTLHPVAGQGFNLGLRDVAVLAEVIADACQAGRDIGDHEILERYGTWRRWDQRRAIAFTDGLVRLFENPLPPLRLARNLGLLAFDLLPAAKRLLARQSMGLAGHLPRLARGLPLRKVS